MSENISAPSPKSPRGLLYGIAAIVLIGIALSLYFLKKENTSGESTPETAAVGTPTAGSGPAAATAPTGAADLTADENGLSKAVAVIETSKGKIKFRFYSNDAPNTSARIAELIQSGFYNGLTFHRVVADFVVQGGDPTGTGTGGSGQKLKSEVNSRKHIPGAVAMARAQDPDSADSQFYITLGTIPHLDGAYTVFGQVSEGMDVVKTLSVGDTMAKVSFE